MKILMIAPEPFLEPRGTPISVYQRLLGLSRLGHKIDLVTYHLGTAVVVPGVAVHRIPRVPLIRAVRSGPSWQKLVLDLLLFFKAFGLLLKNRYDVVHAHEEGAVFAALLGRVFQTRYVYDMHSSLPRQLKTFGLWGSPLLASISRTIESWTIRRADAVITIAPDLAQVVQKSNRYARCVVIDNLPVQFSVARAQGGPVDSLRERLGINGRFPVVYTGNLQAYQGIELLIRGVEMVKARHPEVLCLLVGGRAEEIRHWQAVVRERRLDEFVRFAGAVPMDELPNYLELAEVLVSPRTDGMSIPLKIYSYLYSGKPVVATAIPAHTLVLDDETAVLVAPVEEALAEGIIRLVASPELRRQLGSRALRLAEQKYDAESYQVKLEEVYRPFEAASALLAMPSDAVTR